MSHWIAPLIVLAAGALIGLAWLILTRRAGPAAPLTAPLLDAERTYEDALEQLRELEQDRPKLDPAHYAAERARLEGVAAGALRTRDAATRAAAPTPAPAPARGGLAPELRGALWGGGAVALIGALVALAYVNSAPRAEGDVMTGGGPPGNAAPPAPPRPAAEVLADVMALYDAETLVLAGHRALLSNRAEEAAQLTARALRLDPMHIEARIHSAAIRGLQGEEKEALAELDRILAARREPEALLFTGVLAARAGDRKRAASSLAELRKVTPEGPAADELEKLVASLQEARK